MKTHSRDKHRHNAALATEVPGLRRSLGRWPHQAGRPQVAASEHGATLLIALMVLVVLGALGATAMNSTTIETTIAGYHRASVQAFYAAETGVHIAINQLSAQIETATQAIPVTNLNGSAIYQFRSGGRHDTEPQPLQFLEARGRAGYALTRGTSYNPAGYIFYTYKVNATGLGPHNAQREIEARALYGPVAQ